MLTVKDHNERAANAYASIAGQHWIEALRDGRHVLIRPLSEKDREREYAFIKRLSPESRHMRFLAQINEPSGTMLDQLMDTDNRLRLAYVALVHDNGQLIEIGVSRYAATGGMDAPGTGDTVDGAPDLGGTQEWNASNVFG